MNGDPSSSAQSLRQQQQQERVPLQDSYLQSRAGALQNVESTIHELSNIFTQLASMVSQQGELAIRFNFLLFSGYYYYYFVQTVVNQNQFIHVKILFSSIIFVSPSRSILFQNLDDAYYKTFEQQLCMCTRDTLLEFVCTLCLPVNACCLQRRVS